nr:hypothetical protein CFP56_37264 [Quercus suber]
MSRRWVAVYLLRGSRAAPRSANAKVPHAARLLHLKDFIYCTISRRCGGIAEQLRGNPQRMVFAGVVELVEVVPYGNTPVHYIDEDDLWRSCAFEDQDAASSLELSESEMACKTRTCIQQQRARCSDQAMAHCKDNIALALGISSYSTMYHRAAQSATVSFGKTSKLSYLTVERGYSDDRGPPLALRDISSLRSYSSLTLPAVYHRNHHLPLDDFHIGFPSHHRSSARRADPVLVRHGIFLKGSLLKRRLEQKEQGIPVTNQLFQHQQNPDHAIPDASLTCGRRSSDERQHRTLDEEVVGSRVHDRTFGEHIVVLWSVVGSQVNNNNHKTP